MEASGTDGSAVWDDFVDMAKTIKRKSDTDGGQLYYIVIGLDGCSNIHSQCAKYAKDNVNVTYMLPQNDSIGGYSPAIGWWFQKFNIEGNQFVLCVDPDMDNEEMFPRRLTNGNLAMSSTFYFLDASPNSTGRPNVEIRTKGREGINRNLVSFYSNGMTGEGKPEHAIDGKEFPLLKQNLFVMILEFLINY
ncbi:MAG: hypothetical protein NTX61_05765 [Bacteroidetes bacterium]|nr:hypothetical protein [Bacteroidota bacterium]